MAAAIEREFEVKSELIEGGNGIFLVKVDGDPVYSKEETGRFPDDEEVLSQLRNR